MTLTRRPSPFSELVTLRQAMDRLFDEPFFRPVAAANGTTGDGGNLALDVRTTKDALVVEAALPGVRPEDVDITIENGTLAIRGETATERQETNGAEGRWLVREISRGSFVRTVSLPNGLEADRAEATFENGVLSLRIPKADQGKPKQIRISPVTPGTATDATTTDATATHGTPPSPAATPEVAGEPATDGSATSARG
jgi:HSP20 family protein